MDRLTLITRAAQALRAQVPAEALSQAPGALPSMALAEALCKTCLPKQIDIRLTDAQAAMLGGAWARLQLWTWSKPERGGLIWVQRNRAPQEQAFSIAHELGHLILHRGEGEAPHCPPDAINEFADVGALRVAREGRVEEYNPRARREMEANAFAAELLAPADATRALFLSGPQVAVKDIMTRFGVTERLAQARLVAAALNAAAPSADTDETATETAPTLATPAERAALATTLLARLTHPAEGEEPQRATQYEAATATGPALIVAGPGTGKTATLVGRWAHLYGERGIDPESILALTFSNKATDEMRERLVVAGLPGERAPVMTIHAFATELLRRYASRAPHAENEPELPGDFRILDGADSRLLLEELLPKLKLRRLRRLDDPTGPITDLLESFGWARDRLLTPARYQELVERAPLAPDKPKSSKGDKGKAKPDGALTADERLKQQEIARAYAIWDHELRQRKVLDYGGLIQRAVEMLQADEKARNEACARFQHILVDEFQDTNEAAAALLFLLAGDGGAGLWVVGDRNQSIYRWRGASPDNVPALARKYPSLGVYRLIRNYRSVPDIVRLGSDMAAKMAELDEENARRGPAGALAAALSPVALVPDRPAGAAPAVRRNESYATVADERAALVADMQRRRDEGTPWGAMAALTYKGKLGQALAAALTEHEIPVTMRAEFFERDEIKDALALLRLAASRDAGGMLRIDGLLALLGARVASQEERVVLGRSIRHLIQTNKAFPWALNEAALRDAGAPAPLIAPLANLGHEAAKFWQTERGMAWRLGGILTRPGGLVWRLARIATRQDEPAGAGDPLAPPGATPLRAADALAALGALYSLAIRFDSRWANEEGFRLQLSGLTADEETDEQIDADAPTDTQTTGEPPKAQANPQHDHAVRCFLRYLDTLARAKEDIALPLNEEDAVHIMTINASKGLEFPVVYLHALSRQNFSGNSTPKVRVPLETTPDGSGNVNSETTAREADTRSLLYVGVTRARDTLVITRAQRYGKTDDKPLKAALDLLEPSEVYQHAESLPLATSAYAPDALELAPGADVQRFDTLDSDSEEGDDLADMLEGAPGLNAAATPVIAPGAEKPSYDYYLLDTYLTCPRQYRYRETYHLRNGVGSAAGAFHRFIQTGMAEMSRLRAEQPDMTAAQAREAMAALWEQQPGKRATYAATYRDYALDILGAEWDRIADRGVTQRATLDVELHTCRVKISANAIISPTPDGGESVILERWHTGRPNEKGDTLDVRLALMYLGYQQRNPNARISVRLVYLGAPLGSIGSADAAERQEAARNRDEVDVTKKVCERLKDYDARKGNYQQLFNLDAAAQAIASGHFAPNPNDKKCLQCSFQHICPGDLPD